MIDFNNIIKNLNIEPDNSWHTTQSIPFDVLAILSAKLIECVFLNDLEKAEKLLKKGADILTEPAIYYLEESDNYAKIEAAPESNPYTVAIQFGTCEMLDLFLEYTPNMAKQNKSFFYPVAYQDRLDMLPILSRYNLFNEENMVPFLKHCLHYSKKTSSILNTLLENPEIKQIFYDNTYEICNAYINNSLGFKKHMIGLDEEGYLKTEEYAKQKWSYHLMAKFSNKEIVKALILGNLASSIYIPTLLNPEKIDISQKEMDKFLDKFFINNKQAKGEVFYHHTSSLFDSGLFDLHESLKQYRNSFELPELKKSLYDGYFNQINKLGGFNCEYSFYDLFTLSLTEEQNSAFEKKLIEVKIKEVPNKKQSIKI